MNSIESATPQKPSRNYTFKSRKFEKYIPAFFILAASVSIITTVGIVLTLFNDALHFFRAVPLKDVFSTELAPLAAEPKFGFIPLITGTVLTSVIAMLVATPIGLTAAIYMSQFATDRVRKIIKPIIELLAGIPTIVYGFFAYSFVTPLLSRLIPTLEAKNVLSPGIVMGIMIIPLVTSLSEDAMSSVPNVIREAALGLGSTKLEASVQVVLPAALSGVIASIVLGISRAVGETMIVAIASGSSKRFTLDVTQSIQTMTGYIVEFTSGDAGSGTIGYYSLYAVGLILFVFTLLLNMTAQHISRKFREVY
jgi:phosphate transport system permease protein